MSVFDFNLSRLEDVCEDSIDAAVNVPQPNEDTDLHLAQIKVGDLRRLLQLVRNTKAQITQS